MAASQTFLALNRYSWPFRSIPQSITPLNRRAPHRQYAPFKFHCSIPLRSIPYCINEFRMCTMHRCWPVDPCPHIVDTSWNENIRAVVEIGPPKTICKRNVSLKHMGSNGYIYVYKYLGQFLLWLKMPVVVEILHNSWLVDSWLVYFFLYLGWSTNHRSVAWLSCCFKKPSTRLLTHNLGWSTICLSFFTNRFNQVAVDILKTLGPADAFLAAIEAASNVNLLEVMIVQLAISPTESGDERLGKQSFTLRDIQGCMICICIKEYTYIGMYMYICKY